MTVADQIAAGHASSAVHIGATPMLGLQTAPVVGQAGVAAGGAVVAGVIPGSPADLAGLPPGDVIKGEHSKASPSALGG